MDLRSHTEESQAESILGAHQIGLNGFGCVVCVCVCVCVCCVCVPRTDLVVEHHHQPPARHLPSHEQYPLYARIIWKAKRRGGHRDSAPKRMQPARMAAVPAKG